MNQPTKFTHLKLPPKPLTEAERMRMIIWLQNDLYGVKKKHDNKTK